jgi:hypothetical protein
MAVNPRQEIKSGPRTTLDQDARALKRRLPGGHSLLLPTIFR